MNQYLGPYSLAPFAGVLLATFVFAATVLPETQGTTPEQLAAAAMTRTLYQCMVYQPNVDSSASSQMDLEWQKAMEQLQMEEDRERQHPGTYTYEFQTTH